MNSLKQLSPPELKVAAKTLILNGYSSRQVEDILKIDNVTALRYAEAPTNDEMKQFETIFDNYVRSQKQKGIAIVYKRLLELIPKEKRIDGVVKAGEYLEGKTSGAQVNIAQNQSVNFIIQTTKDEQEFNSLTPKAE